MKRILSTFVIVILLTAYWSCHAQNYIYRGGTSIEFNNMSTAAEHNAILDSTLLNISIFNLLKNVSVNQSSQIAAGMNYYLDNNKERKISGYRVRIFFDNKQSARKESETIASDFSDEYPQIGVYRQYENPYFKVTVGDFRTKSDALKFLNTIKNKYPSVFVVKENINYPL